MDQTRFIVAGSFIDGTGADVRRNVFLAVKDSIIAAIGPAADLPHNDGAVVDDFSHCTIVPAMVDCSVSLSRSPSVDRKVRFYPLKRQDLRKSQPWWRSISATAIHTEYWEWPKAMTVSAWGAFTRGDGAVEHH